MNGMDGIGNNKFGSSSPLTPETPAASAPPPPSEVKVRTMRSDLASMARTGGGLPRFENVKVEGLSAQLRASQPIGIPVRESEAPIAHRTNVVMVVFAIIAAVAAVGILGYIGYQNYFAKGSGVTAAPPVTHTPFTAATTTASTTPSAPAPLVHVSLFKKPVDQVLTLTLGAAAGAATSSAALLSFDQKLAALVATANRTSTFVEILVRDGSGNAVGIGTILSQANEALFDPAFLSANFNQDATFFAYRDKNGWWPGYVLSLQTGKNWLFLQSDVAQAVESSPATENFFLNDPGAPSPDGFTDSLIASSTVRVLPFLNAPVPTYFVYGWSGGNLILSASQTGFAAAVAHFSAP